jgi:hypothetical protein
MEQLDYNLLYRWFVGQNMDDRKSGTKMWNQEDINISIVPEAEWLVSRPGLEPGTP